MTELIENINNENVLTPIQKFYFGAGVFITGGTGFLGKILIEKLLRSCPVSAIYILVRHKKGKNMHARVDELFDDVLFDRLKVECPKFRLKVVGVGGDCSLPELGLGMQDRQLLLDEVNVVFHLAATVKFDEKLKLAVATNVKGPQEIIRLCRGMSKLKAVMHISTAYSNCQLSVIEEKFYPPPMDCKKLIILTDLANEKLLENIAPTILGKWPNTYAFTKAVAEDVILQEGHGLPIAVYRPAIIISSYKEPIEGWMGNLYGPIGVCAGAGTGVIRTMHCDPNVNANVIPVDMCVNALIASAWEVGDNFKTNKDNQVGYEVPVYHFESSNDKPISCGKFMEYSAYYGLKFPTLKAIWYYCLVLQKSAIAYNLTVFFLHILPAAICDTALLCIGKSPRILNIYKKIHRFAAAISYFVTRNLVFKSEKVQSMWKKMSAEDQKIFFCDLKQIDWDEYFKEYVKGIRIHLLGDPINTLELAKVKWNRLYWLHQTCKVMLGFLFLRLVWMILSSLMT